MNPAERGAGLRVFATARNADKLAGLHALGLETFALDVTSDDSVKSAADKVAQLTGGTLDILFNNAYAGSLLRAANA